MRRVAVGRRCYGLYIRGCFYYNAPMQAHKSDNFNDRLSEASKARKAAMEKFRNLPKPNDPVVLERAAAQKAVAEAREARIAERKAAREAEAARLAAEEAARVAEAARQAEEQRQREIEQAARDAEAARLYALENADRETRAAILDEEKRQRALALAAEQKAARDARYAARKSRKR